MDNKAKENKQKILRRIRRKRRKKQLLMVVIMLIAAALAAAIFFAVGQTSGQEQTVEEMTFAEAFTGEITHKVFASGSVLPVSQPGAYAKTDGTISVIYAEMGDYVKAGDVIAVLENETLETEIVELSIALSDAQDEVEATKTYEQRVDRQLYWDNGTPRMNEETGEPLTANYSNELMIRAPVKGRVMAIYIKEGDDALAVYREQGAVMLLSTDGKMKVLLDGVEIGLLELNQQLRITGEGVETTGRVVNLIRRGTQVHVEVIGDEFPMDTPVVVETMDGVYVGEGILEINKPLGISAYSGTIGSIVVTEGQLVEREDRLARFVIGDRPLYIDNASILHDYAVALASLETAEKKRDSLTILAPCDGWIATVDAAEGDEATDGTLIATLVADEGMQITLTVDELDIVKVHPGQEVVMSIDALDNAQMTGVVQKIAPLGNTETSVTTYDVYIYAEGIDPRVLSGMNVSGEIAVESASGAVLIATDALKKDGEGYFLTLESGETRRVTTGIMTEEYTQILSGMDAGEIAVY